MAKSIVGPMLTRYAWVPLVGAVLGAGAALGMYATMMANNPRYTARVPFLVVPPQPAIGATEAPPAHQTMDDANQILHQQEFWFQQDKFLQDVLAAQEFHTPPQGQAGNDCQWLMENKNDPVKHLKRDLVVVQKFDTAAFEVTMTARNPMDSYNLVLAAVKVYMQRLHADVAKRQTAYLKKLSDAVTRAEAAFQIKSDTLLDYQKRKGIDVLKTRYEIEKNALQALNDDYTRADTIARSAEQQYDAIEKTKADGKEIRLSSDLLQSVENDPTLKALLAARLNWDQEKAVAETNSAANPARLVEVNARLTKIDDQINEMHRMLTNNAQGLMEQTLSDAAANNRFTANYIGTIRKAKEDIVTGIGQDLLVWQQKVDDLKEQGDLVTRVRSQLNLAQANQAIDDTRVQQIDEPVVPDKPSWPEWDTFMPEGAGGGLGLGLILAGLAAWRHSRRERVFPPGADIPHATT